ncbi:MAG: hypothetical protein AABW51_03760 [Nanoarchaeota archaeon]
MVSYKEYYANAKGYLTFAARTLARGVVNLYPLDNHILFRECVYIHNKSRLRSKLDDLLGKILS